MAGKKKKNVGKSAGKRVRKPASGNRRKGGRGVLAVLAGVLGLALAIAAYHAAIWAIDNRLPAFRQTGYIHIQPEMSVEQVAQQVIDELDPRIASSVYRTLALETSTHSLVPGMYRITTRSSARYMARAVTRGWQSPINVVISTPARFKSQVISQLASQMMVEEQQLSKTFNDSKVLADYGTTPDKIFEMIIPDTYQMYWSASPREILGRLKKENDRFWNEERVELARRQGLTPSQVAIVASIVAEESHVPDEYPKIASVYLTRLKKGMKLQADPTICYIYGYSIRRVLKKHLSTESPYNTYLHAGLPPTPICLPSKEHIEAVLHPDTTPYLYFCASEKMNGRHNFARTYAEHLDNAGRFHKALDSLMLAKAYEQE